VSSAARTDEATVTDHRKRPRRRGAALDAAILEATMAELAEVGYARLSVERVAERASASKASLYRRWPGKVELVMDAVYHVLPDPASAPDTGSLRGDLLALLRAVADQLAGPAGQAMRGLLSDALRDPERAAQLREYARGTSLQTMREVVRRAGERGELDATAITTRQLETGHALMRFHFLTHGAPIPDGVVVEIVDEVVLPLVAPARD
jgi:AcrR family transcriptional regulator